MGVGRQTCTSLEPSLPSDGRSNAHPPHHPLPWGCHFVLRWSQGPSFPLRSSDSKFLDPPRLRGIIQGVWLWLSYFSPLVMSRATSAPISRRVPLGLGPGGKDLGVRTSPPLPSLPCPPIPSHPHLHSLRRFLSAACSIAISHDSVQETQGPSAAPGSPVDPGRDGQQAAQPR